MVIGASGVQYDDQGFIQSQKKTESKLESIDQNIAEILALLKGESQSSLGKYKPTKLQLAMYRGGQVQNFGGRENSASNNNPQRRTAQSKNNNRVVGAVKDYATRERDTAQTNTNAKDQASTSKQTRKQLEQNRDAKGRFIAGEAKTINALEQFARTFGGGAHAIGADTQGFDPTVDAINELGTVMSPVKRVASGMLKPLSGFFKNRKRNEPLPKEQTDHNRKQLKMLERIAQNVKSGKGGLLGALLGRGLLGGAGLLGGLLGKGGKGLGKLLKFGKGIPFLGTALSAMSLMDWDKKSTAEKGGSVGAVGGGVIGGAIGSLFSPIGTIVGAGIGSWIGDKLGSTVAPYVANWTNKLIQADIPTKMLDAWSGFVENIKEKVSSAWDNLKEMIPNPVKNVASMAWGGIQAGFSAVNMARKGVWNWATGGDSVGDGKALEGASAKEKTLSLLRKHEGFRSKAYWDVNAWRTGYGSDTYTDARGKIHKVTKNTVVSKEDAERDLMRRSEIFANQARKKSGAKNWDKLPDDTKAALTSVAYNYGSLPDRVSSAVKTGDIDKVSQSVRSLQVHNGGVNRNRRNHEADLIKNSRFAEPAQAVVKNTTSEPTKTVEPTKAKINKTAQSPQSGFAPAQTISQIMPSYKVPKVESAKIPLTASAPQRVIVANQSSDTINQNLSNRGLAHAVTGGIGREI